MKWTLRHIVACAVLVSAISATATHVQDAVENVDNHVTTTARVSTMAVTLAQTPVLNPTLCSTPMTLFAEVCNYPGCNDVPCNTGVDDPSQCHDGVWIFGCWDRYSHGYSNHAQFICRGWNFADQYPGEGWCPPPPGSADDTNMMTTSAGLVTTTPIPGCASDAIIFEFRNTTLCVPPMFYPHTGFEHCVLECSWADVARDRNLFAKGGLGKMMRDHQWEVWVCTSLHQCTDGVDWMCFTYSEVHDVFVPWGLNSVLHVIKRK